MQKKTNRSVSGATDKAPILNVSAKNIHSPEIDSKILSSFKRCYVYKTFLAEDSIEIAVHNGVVTISGTVSEESHKILAFRTISHLPGVVRVENELVTTAEAAAENAAENIDTWIGRKVKLSLLFHYNVNAIATTVQVKDRVVMLKGEASSMAQKELTSEYASDIEGVKAVINEMTVATTPEPAKRTTREKIDDASVIAQVYAALMIRHSTSASKVDVKARNGEVVLTGIARNAAEKALVSKIVTDVNGVTDVKNQMTIEEASSS